jgi:hypothetical protein
MFGCVYAAWQQPQSNQKRRREFFPQDLKTHQKYSVSLDSVTAVPKRWSRDRMRDTGDVSLIAAILSDLYQPTEHLPLPPLLTHRHEKWFERTLRN